jgi:nucleoside-diphosphate-sugar epimerase
MLKVLVLGAADFIGSRVHAALAACGWATPIADALGAGAPLAIDARDPRSLARALQDVDAVVSCLQGKPAAILAGAQALYGAAAQRQQGSTNGSPGGSVPPLIVHVSSMSVYGSAWGEVREDAPLQADLGAYAQAQAQAEAIAAGYGRSVILRPGCEYGPGGEIWSGRIARLLHARRLGDLGAAGDGLCNLVHVDDLAAAVLLCLRNPASAGAAFNLAIDDPPTWNTYFVRFARALGAVPVKRLGRRELALETKLLAPPLKAIEIGARAAGLRSIAPTPIPPSLLRLAGQEIRLVADRARQVLGWSCRPLDQGLAETAAWFHRDARGLG